ncbi:MAG: FxsA family protein [Gammaproteobacteria bacterium]|nr:FxsA family protein [Gammaproteobacteria bacterium]
MNPLKILIVLFVAIPVIEIYLLIKVGSVIGAIPTILMIIGTAVLGASLLRMQGISTFQRVQSTMQRGEIPALEMMEGLILLISGALLLTPGFFTDAIGFIALIPPARRAFIMWALKHSNIIQTSQFSQHTYNGTSYKEEDGHIVIEGKYKKED